MNNLLPILAMVPLAVIALVVTITTLTDSDGRKWFIALSGFILIVWLFFWGVSKL